MRTSAEVLPSKGHCVRCTKYQPECLSSLVRVINIFSFRLISWQWRLLGTAKKNKQFMLISLLLLANSGDIETNQKAQTDTNHSDDASTSSLCSTCKEQVTWDHKGVMCETRDTWDHTHFQNINDSTYERLGNTSVAWTCLKCNDSNYSTILFDLHGLQSSNHFSSLGTSTLSSIDSIDSQVLAQPQHASSPIHPKPKAVKCVRPLRIINVNCQSLVNKKRPFYNLLDSSRPDVIIATETWFQDEILDSEYFDPEHYAIQTR